MRGAAAYVFRALTCSSSYAHEQELHEEIEKKLPPGFAASMMGEGAAAGGSSSRADKMED